MKLNKTFFYLLAVTIMAATFNSCSPKTELETGVQHFRSLQFSETQFDKDKGLHPLTAKEAQTVNNYRFTYDESNRLVEIAYCRGEQLLSYGSWWGYSKITYTYEGNKQTKHYFNEKNEQIEGGGAWAAEFILDEKGVRTSMEYKDKEGNPTENRNDINRYTWKLLDNGLVQELRYNLANESVIMNRFCPFYELRFAYDEKGMPTKMMNFQGDSLYNCTAENCGDIGVSYFEFANNEAGDILSFSVHNTVGQLSNLYWGWAKRVSKVDENGYQIEMAVFDQDDEYMSGNNVPVTQSKYDDHGALIERRNLDKDRVLMNHPTEGVAITRYTYDEKGVRLETLKFDKDELAVVTE